MEKAIFGAGCFWGVEEAFRTMEGVGETLVGYAGGTAKKPTYQQVCDDASGHAEVVEIIYDPDVISYGSLLETFFTIHDPTQVNRQGPDIGSQYRSVIFYTSEQQKSTAQNYIQSLQEKYSKPIATQLEPAPTVYPAEEYHQKYLMKRGKNVC